MRRAPCMARAQGAGSYSSAMFHNLRARVPFVSCVYGPCPRPCPAPPATSPHSPHALPTGESDPNGQESLYGHPAGVASLSFQALWARPGPASSGLPASSSSILPSPIRLNKQGGVALKPDFGSNFVMVNRDLLRRVQARLIPAIVPWRYTGLVNRWIST